MERLLDPAKSLFVARINIDGHSIKPIYDTYTTQPEAAPLNYYAALYDSSDLVEHLIASDSRYINSRGGSHTTPLHVALVKGQLFVASLLLRNGANPDSRDDCSRTPLHKVAESSFAFR